MISPEKIQYGSFIVYSYDKSFKPSDIVDQIPKGELIQNKGRGGIRILSVDGKKLACRKYLHGGLLRAITGDRFLSEKRALDEADILNYLEEKDFPAVHPCCVIAERTVLAKRLYLITGFVQDSEDLLDVWKRASRMKRFRIIKCLAGLMRRLELLGIYHPDLHINNILVTGPGDLIFLDFDRAYKKAITMNDMERMFWRLNRYMEKQARKGDITLDIQEKVFFLRVYQKLAGYAILSYMEKQQGMRNIWNRIGWFVESFFYGGKR